MFGVVCVMIIAMKVIQTSPRHTARLSITHCSALSRHSSGGCCGCAGVVDVWSGGCYDYSNESDPDIT